MHIRASTVRTLQDGSQTVLAYNADSANLDSYTDPMDSVDYTFDAANRLTELTDPEDKITTFDYYNNNDQRIKTTYPGGTVQDVDLDDSGRPQRITASSGAGTLVDLSYDYSYSVGGETVDGTKIRTKTTTTAAPAASPNPTPAARFATPLTGGVGGYVAIYCYGLTAAGLGPAIGGLFEPC